MRVTCSSSRLRMDCPANRRKDLAGKPPGTRPEPTRKRGYIPHPFWVGNLLDTLGVDNEQDLDKSAEGTKWQGNGRGTKDYAWGTCGDGILRKTALYSSFYRIRKIFRFNPDTNAIGFTVRSTSRAPFQRQPPDGHATTIAGSASSSPQSQWASASVGGDSGSARKPNSASPAR